MSSLTVALPWTLEIVEDPPTGVQVTKFIVNNFAEPILTTLAVSIIPAILLVAAADKIILLSMCFMVLFVLFSFSICLMAETPTLESA